jgi:hypothetical protein
MRMATPAQPTAVNFPSVGTQPGFSVRPRSAEDLVKQAAAAKAAEPYTLSEGQTRIENGQVVGRGTPKPKNVTPINNKLVDGKPAVGLVFDHDLNQYIQNGQDVTSRVTDVPRQGRDPGVADARAFNEQMRKYTAEIANGHRQQADALKIWTEQNTEHFGDPEWQAAHPAPTYVPPSVDDWLASHPAAGAAGKAKKGDTKPIPGYPGTEQTYNGQKWVRTK